MGSKTQGNVLEPAAHLPACMQGNRHPLSGSMLQCCCWTVELSAATYRFKLCGCRTPDPAEVLRGQARAQHVSQQGWEAAVAGEVAKEVGGLPVCNACTNVLKDCRPVHSCCKSPAGTSGGQLYSPCSPAGDRLLEQKHHCGHMQGLK